MERLNKDIKYIRKERGIYMIWSSTKLNMYYIGSTINFRKRYNEHYNLLLRGKHYNKKLQNHVNKYGIKDLNFCIHIVIDDNITDLELRLMEQKEIKYYDSFKNGFNLTDDTIRPFTNFIWTEEMRKNLSDKAKIRQSNPLIKLQIKNTTNGTKNGSAAFTSKDITFIRESKLSNKDLSLIFNVNIKTIWRVVNNITYTVNK